VQDELQLLGIEGLITHRCCLQHGRFSLFRALQSVRN